MWSSKPCKGLDICSRAKAVSSFLSHIKTLSMVRPLRNPTRDLPLDQAVKAPFRLRSIKRPGKLARGSQWRGSFEG